MTLKNKPIQYLILNHSRKKITQVKLIKIMISLSINKVKSIKINRNQLVKKTMNNSRIIKILKLKRML